MNMVMSESKRGRNVCVCGKDRIEAKKRNCLRPLLLTEKLCFFIFTLNAFCNQSVTARRRDGFREIRLDGTGVVNNKSFFLSFCCTTFTRHEKVKWNICSIKFVLFTFCRIFWIVWHRGQRVFLLLKFSEDSQRNANILPKYGRPVIFLMFFCNFTSRALKLVTHKTVAQQNLTNLLELKRKKVSTFVTSLCETFQQKNRILTVWNKEFCLFLLVVAVVNKIT